MKKDKKINKQQNTPWTQAWSSLGTWQFFVLSFFCALISYQNITLSFSTFFFLFLFNLSDAENNKILHDKKTYKKFGVFSPNKVKKIIPRSSLMFLTFFIFLSIIFTIKQTQKLEQAEPNNVPLWLENMLNEQTEAFKKGQELSFKIASITGLYDGRLRLIISNLQPINQEKDNNTQDIFSNEMENKAVLNIQNAQSFFNTNAGEYPIIGASYSGILKIRTQRGFKNTNTQNTDEYWLNQGVNYRGLTVQNKTKFTLIQQSTAINPDEKTWSFSSIQHYFDKLRNQLLQQVQLSLKPELSESRGIIYALISGDRQFISSQTASLFQRSALIHSLALSGMHLGLVFLASFTLISGVAIFKPQIYLKVPRIKLAFFLSIPFALIYLWLGAFSPSLIRAAFMLMIATVTIFLGNLRKIEDALILTILLVAIIDPGLVFELSFQLSVLSITAIILFLPLIQLGIKKITYLSGHFWLKRCIRVSLTILFLSLSIQIFLIPITSFYFGEVPVFFILNVLWIPVLTFLVLPLAFLGFVLVNLSLFYLAELIFTLSAFITDVFLNILIFLDNNNILLTFTTLRPLPEATLAFFILAILMIIFISNKLKHLETKKLHQFILLIAFILSLYPVLFRYFPYSEQKQNVFSIKVLDVGQAQALLIESFGRRLICDGGGFNSKYFDSGRHILTPILTYNQAPRLDFVINTHPDNDHLKGILFLLDNFSISRIAFSSLPKENSLAPLLSEIIQKNNLNIEFWRKGERILFAENNTTKIYIEVLYPNNPAQFPNPNENSLVLRFVKEELGNSTGLLLVLGDLQQKGLKDFLTDNQQISAELLVLPHHGSSSSLNIELYKRVNPKLALASAGYKNSWEFPSKQVREVLEQLKIPLRTSSEEGEIFIKLK